MVKDACATQALLSIILNADVELGERLKSFKIETENLAPELKGNAIGKAEFLNKAHNSFSDKNNIPAVGIKNEDAFHFVAYIPKDKMVYEVDGLKGSPRLIGEFSSYTWLNTALEDIRKRIER